MAIPAMPLNGAGVPDLLPWATTAAPADIAEPTAPEKSAGWATNQLPPHEWFNWYQFGYGKWVERLRTTALFYDSATGVAYNAYKTDAGSDVHATADFVWGSETLDYPALAARAARMFFDKSKSAFRAGYSGSNRWDDANRGNYSAAFGYETKASGDYSFAAGDSCTANGDHSLALLGGQATGAYAMALGLATSAGLRSIAIGSATCSASGQDSCAIGENAVTAVGATASFAGAGGTCLAANTVSIGNGSQCQVVDGIAIGTMADAQGSSSISIGAISEAAENAVCVGRSGTASGLRSCAIGYIAQALGLSSVAMGEDAQAQAAYAVAIGISSRATVGDATAVGSQAQATATGASALGRQTIASGDYSLALGGGDLEGVHGAEAAAADSVALGRGASTTAGGTGGAAVGKGSTIGAAGVEGLAGSGGTSNGTRATAIGKGLASGEESLAQGDGAVALGAGSRAFGQATGIATSITSSGEGSEAGGSTEASSFTVDKVTASATASRAFGKGALADQRYGEAHGYMAYARIRGLRSQSGAPLGGSTGAITTQSGEAQTGVLDCKVISRSNTSEVLDPSGRTTATETISIRDDYAARIEGGWIAYSDTAVVESGKILLVAKQAGGGGGALTLPVNTIAFETANPNGWTVVATVVGTNGIAITVTGHAAAGNINWECWLRLTEVRVATV